MLNYKLLILKLLLDIRGFSRLEAPKRCLVNNLKICVVASQKVFVARRGVCCLRCRLRIPFVKQTRHRFGVRGYALLWLLSHWEKHHCRYLKLADPLDAKIRFSLNQRQSLALQRLCIESRSIAALAKNANSPGIFKVQLTLKP